MSTEVVEIIREDIKRNLQTHYSILVEDIDYEPIRGDHDEPIGAHILESITMEIPQDMGRNQLIGYCLDVIQPFWEITNYDEYMKSTFDEIENRLEEIDEDIPPEGGKDYAHLLAIFTPDYEKRYLLVVEKTHKEVK